MLMTSPPYGVKRVTGRNIAHAKRSAVERALMAADLHLDRYALIRPTIGQAAELLKVCPAYVAAAARIAHDEKARDAVLSGRVPLAVAGWSESLTDRYLRSSPAERINLTQTAGVDHLWDELIIPAL
jgi:hypothetical protein